VVAARGASAALPETVRGGCSDRVPVQPQLHGAGANMGDNGYAQRAAQSNAHNAARNVNWHKAARQWQDAFHARGAAVDVDLAHIQPEQVEDRIPRRRLDVEPPGMRRVELQFSQATAPQLTNDHPIATDSSRGGCAPIVGG